MFRTVALVAVIFAIAMLGGTSAARAHTNRATVQGAKVRYYHAEGIVKWIGSHARVTQYHPNPKKKAHWQAAVRFYRNVAHDAWLVMHPPVDNSLEQAFLCIHRYEGAWNANTENGYYGGLQMDYAFQSLYGSEFLHLYGTADHWPIPVQIQVASRDYNSGLGLYPWPNTARACGLI